MTRGWAALGDKRRTSLRLRKARRMNPNRYRTFRSGVTLGAFLLTASISTAAAEISIRRAEFSAGVLVVHGDTSKPHQTVWLDRRYSERSNRFGDFTFRIRYVPNDCTIQLAAGEDIRTAFVTGCSVPAPAYRPLPKSSR